MTMLGLHRPLGALGLSKDTLVQVQSSSWNSVVDFFRNAYLDADEEQRVIMVNNYWQLLWRSTRQAGVSEKDPSFQKLDSLMGQWWDWKLRYDDAALRRWIPIVGHDWSKDLDTWADRWVSMVEELDQKASLEAGGLDTSGISKEAWDRSGETALDNLLNRFNQALSSSWFWPVAGLAGAMFFVSWVIKTGRAFR